MASARASKVPVAETGAATAVKAMPPVTLEMTVLPMKAVAAMDLPVNTVMAGTDMHADAGMDRLRRQGRRYGQCDNKQADTG
jgi:hypothetical protein